MRNRTYGGVRGRKTKVGEKLLRFPPTRFEFGTQPAFDRWFCGHCETFGTTGLWTERIDGIKIPFLGNNGEKKNKL